MDLLILLVERRRQLVTRSEIVDRLWGKDVFIDVETGINTVISKVRQALRDSADTPAFVETVAGKGYRFIAPVEVVSEPHGEAFAQSSSPPARMPAGDESDARFAISPVNSNPIAPNHDIPATSTSTAAAQSAPVSTSQPRSPARFMVGVVVFGLVAGLAAWAWFSTGAPSRVTIAVLPFENMSSDRERDYLADGLAEETSAALGQIDPEHVSVIGRTSTLTYRGSKKSLAQIGRELGADYLVESSIRAESGRLRVTSKLIQVSNQVQVWSSSYDREPIGVLGMQRELSSAIAEQVRLRLAPERLNGLGRRQTRNADAYDLYLRGRYFGNQRVPETNARAIQYYERAIALDPNYALAWSGIADTYAASAINGDAPPLTVGPRARDAAARAFQAAPDLAEVQAARGYVSFSIDWDWTGAEVAVRRAIALDPHYAVAHRQLGHLLSQMGRHEEARAAMDRARELDPLEPTHHALSSQVAFQARDYSMAVEHARQALILDSEFWIAYVQMAQAYEQLGKTAMAFDALRNAERLSERNSKSLSLRGYLLATSGRANEAREVLKTLEAVSRERYVPPYALALVHAGLGERDAVFDWLDRAYSARDVHLIFLTVDPKWDPYRGDPRFEALLARCGFTRRASRAETPRIGRSESGPEEPTLAVRRLP